MLTEALAQDNYIRNLENCKVCKSFFDQCDGKINACPRKIKLEECPKSKKLTDSRREVSKSIQMIHRYRDNMLAKIKNPVENETLEINLTKAVKMEEAGFGEVEHVAIFDEAQRSWTHKRLADYLKRGGIRQNDRRYVP